MRGRIFPFTADLRTLLKAQQAKVELLKKAGTITPLVFYRMVADERGGTKSPQPIVAFGTAWKNA